MIQIEPSETPEIELHNQASNLIEQLRAQDPETRIHPYSHNDGKIFGPSDDPKLPKAGMQLKRYFDMSGLISKSGQRMYGHLRLGTYEDHKELIEAVQGPLRDFGISIYWKEVQSHRTVDHCWLFQTTRSTNTVELVNFFKNKHDIEIRARWKTISLLDRYGQKVSHKGKNQDQIPRAVHLEVTKSEESRLRLLMRIYFSSATVSFPYGNDYRAMPVSRKNTTSPASSAELRVMANEQLRYNLDMASIETDIFTDINMILQVPALKPLEITVCEFIKRIVFSVHGREFQPLVEVSSKWNDSSATVMTVKKPLQQI